MKTLIVGPKLVPTDSMILSGSLRLFNRAGLTPTSYITINDHADEDICPPFLPDNIVVLGTPWLWDQCWKSFKYSNLQRLFIKYPYAKRLFFGIGSCFPLGKEEEIKNNLLAHIDKLEIFSGAQIITRDVLSTEVLHRFSPTLLPCPAYYSLRTKADYPQDHYPVMFWYDPTKGISACDFSPGSSQLDEYLTKFQDAYKRTEPVVYCISPIEIDLALKIGLPKPSIIDSIDHAKILLTNASSIFSGRVHLAVPAYMLYKPIELIPVDSRAEVLYSVLNGKIKHPINAIKDYTNILMEYLKFA